MEEPAVQQEKPEGCWEAGHEGEKADWKNDCSLSSLLKHSCLFCWSTPKEADMVESDARVLNKAAEIRELENSVTVENLELQEQQSDRKELEDTLVKLDQHKQKLLEQIKATRQLCYEESQQILSLQSEEVKKESQVEEYERELARARWRLRKLREEVKQAKKKVEEAGERNVPLQDSIRQSYEEILQEESTLCSLSGGAVTPESQLEESTSPADTTEDDPLPMRPWGRSQSLPAYADLIMDANGLPFCHNLAGTREEDDSETSSPKMDRSDLEDDPEEDEEEPAGEQQTKVLRQLDFYQADPFAHCQSDHDVFNGDLFPKTETSDAFASDPFKGSDPFGADTLFPDTAALEGPANVADEADTSLSCAENKASTGTQCFESEFPDEDSDIEISYSREDLDAIAVENDSLGFKPIQSSSEELGPEPIHGWRSQGQYSVESDPNGYELDLRAVSPPSDIEEHSLGSVGGAEPTNAPQQDLCSGAAQDALGCMSDPFELDLTDSAAPGNVTSSPTAEWVNKVGNKPTNSNPESPGFQSIPVQPGSDENSFEFGYEPSSQSSFDPYGFKLSPEHSSHTLLDPDDAELSPEPAENDLTFDPSPSSPQPDQSDFGHYKFELTPSLVVRDSDPYGFKLSPEEENQEVLDHSRKKPEEGELFNFGNREVVTPQACENQETPDLCGQGCQDLLDFCNNGNQQVLESGHHNNQDLTGNQEVLDQGSHDEQELVELLKPNCYDNQELVESYIDTSNQGLLEPHYYDNQESVEAQGNTNMEGPLDPCCYNKQELVEHNSSICNQVGVKPCYFDNQEVLEPDHRGNQELLSFCPENQEVFEETLNQDKDHPGDSLRFDCQSHDNQEVLDLMNKEVLPETNNNNQSTVEPQSYAHHTHSSSDSDETLEELLGRDTTVNATNTVGSLITAISSMSANRHNVLEGDLGLVFGAGGYISCPDVADDLEPLDRRLSSPVEAPAMPVRPIRPPRPSLRAKEKAQTQEVDLK
ncbi:uncharacterized protein LOC114478709 isoform X2 [Gouania willdenowi]|uniref:Uncharacterized LOC114478709 n=1 Tax=Gouania willdenowi TaxID=441366 RepID=A0A8C5GH99_GOUWI|nr:uncharacterized protein LOC114478709 isoform X2 [Gouania willdenowi]